MISVFALALRPKFVALDLGLGLAAVRPWPCLVLHLKAKIMSLKIG